MGSRDGHLPKGRPDLTWVIKARAGLTARVSGLQDGVIHPVRKQRLTLAGGDVLKLGKPERDEG